MGGKYIDTFKQLKCVLCLTAHKRSNIDWVAQSFACQCASLAQDLSVLIAAELGPLVFMLLSLVVFISCSLEMLYMPALPKFAGFSRACAAVCLARDRLTVPVQ